MTSDIRSLRLGYGFRQREVAKALGITGHQMRKLERGLELPSGKEFSILAKLFKVSKKQLVISQERYCKRVTPGEGYTTAKATNTEVVSASKKRPHGSLRVLDLFCGCGGLSFGLEWTGHFTTVCGIDLLRDRVDSFLDNHPYANAIVGDVCKITTTKINEVAGDIDVIVGGPPCQGFSSIRPFRTLTEGDRRNSLVEHYVALVGALQPRWFLFENVVGVLTHGRGEMLSSLLAGFEEAGYTASWRILNAAHFGVPQSRERLVIVGNRNGIDFEWPEPTHFLDYKSMAGSRQEISRTEPLFSQHLPRALTVLEATSDLAAVEHGTERNSYASAPRNEYQALMRQDSTGVTLHRATRHSAKMLEIIKHAGPNISSIPKHLISSGFSTCYSRLDADKPSTTLTVNFVHPASNRCIHPIQDRALTIREGARIQSFPDRFHFRGTTAHIVKQIGNAVPPLLAHALGNAIFQSISSAGKAYFEKASKAA